MAMDYDFGVDVKPASKRPRVDIGDMHKLLELAKHPGKNGWETWNAILAQLPSGSIDERGGHTFTLLHHAAEQGRTEAVKLLIDSKADPHLKVKGKNLTARDLAEQKGHDDVVRMLDGRGGDMDELLELAKHPGKNGRETWNVILAKLPSGSIDERGGHTFTLL